jgi:hypothetical protein
MTIQPVIPGFAAQYVVAEASLQCVVTVTASKLVSTFFANQQIVAPISIDLVVVRLPI